eukprot:TRINITY_DN2810_c0_g2_i1.p1 TRINITY_DN2810_c0_g2~~TRINITY_DN2810_c0_g2_i1.p1  ORF type:complete len:509 (+),score=123.52 TRINITY_DN2810_c0_g2_i1:29-1528(+)
MYRKLPFRRTPIESRNVTNEQIHWRSFRKPEIERVANLAYSIDFSPVDPYPFVIGSGNRLIIYDTSNFSVYKSHTKFNDNIFCTAFRSDARIIVAGGERGVVKCIRSQNGLILKQFNNHEDTVRNCFFRADNTSIVTSGDDCKVNISDLPTGELIASITDAHSSYIRDTISIGNTMDLIATCSKDGLVKVWDLRNQAQIHTFAFEEGVESLCDINGSTMAIGHGPTIDIVDLVSGKTLVSNRLHQKDISTIIIDKKYGRLISGGLDGMIKFIEPQKLDLIESLHSPVGVLDLAISPDDGTLVSCHADSSLALHRSKKETSDKKKKEFEFESQGDFVSFLSGIQKNKKRYRKVPQGLTTGDNVVKLDREIKSSQIDKLLRAFKYTEALEYVANTKNAEIVVSLVQELLNRNALVQSVVGMDTESTVKFLNVLRKTFTIPHYNCVTIEASAIVLECLFNRAQREVEIFDSFQKMKQAIEQELELTNALYEITGITECLVNQ